MEYSVFAIEYQVMYVVRTYENRKYSVKNGAHGDKKASPFGLCHGCPGFTLWFIMLWTPPVK